ncbi:MAG: LCP family protein [Eubacterium sp.]
MPFSTKTYATYSKVSPERKTYKYTKGKMEMDGATALTYARERHSFGSGDMTRNKNQVKVLKAIEKKLMSGSTLLHYNSVLDAVKNSFTTDMDIFFCGLLQMHKARLEHYVIQRYRNTFHRFLLITDCQNQLY